MRDPQVEDTNPHILSLVCVRCEVLLGRDFSHVRGTGPLCEVCADHTAQEYYRRQRREQETWSSWLRGLMGGYP